jgi:alginate O-acetyltransferase complex protein AlgI
MLFNSFPFLGFFCLVFAVYWVLPGRRPRLLWLLLASLYFYMSWNPWLVTLILFSASVDYLSALQMERLRRPWLRRLLLLASVSTNLGLLIFFKYVNFFLASVYALQGWLGGAPAQRFLDIALPLGISFYTFETISYITDVYRGRTRAVSDPLAYALYIFFFPHLVSGPIVRPHHFLPQVQRLHRFNGDRLQLGVQFFLLGLFKKSVLADNLVATVDPVFAAPGLFASSATWLAVLAYSAQIYLDFSGYSDMAVGLAHMLGYHLPANFDRPYLAASLPEFWRRWHISLSSWLRDYLFIPLGGSRGGQWQTCRNLFATMLLGGLWHGASWTFVAWGAFHGSLLVAHRVLPRWSWRESTLLRPLAVATTFLMVCVGWVFFRAQTFADAGTILSHLFYPAAGYALPRGQIATVLAVLAVLAAGHLAGTIGDLRRRERLLPAGVVGAGLTVLLLLVLLFSPENGKAFLYFQF